MSLERQITAKIADKDFYLVETLTGKTERMSGKRLKAYIHSNRGRINLDSIINMVPAANSGKNNTGPIEQPGMRNSSNKKEKQNAS